MMHLIWAMMRFFFDQVEVAARVPFLDLLHNRVLLFLQISKVPCQGTLHIFGCPGTVWYLPVKFLAVIERIATLTQVRRDRIPGLISMPWVPILLVRWPPIVSVFGAFGGPWGVVFGSHEWDRRRETINEHLTVCVCVCTQCVTNPFF